MSKLIKPEDESGHNIWPLPQVEPNQKVDSNKTNAFGHKSNWKYEPPEETVIDTPKPLTAEEIEEIRQAALDDGFSQGKEEGFSKGYEEGKALGHEEGLKSGHEEGIASGLETGKESIDKLSEDWQSLITQLHQPMANIEKNVEELLCL